MAQFNREQVLALAPDSSAASAGQLLANPRKWQNLGGDEIAAWGECQGSGAKPYQVQIDLAGPTFKCSCPSRKFPCKHGLGLLLMLVSSNELFSFKEQPTWVKEWLAGRVARAEKKAQKAEDAEKKPVDPEAQAIRLEKRLDRITDGMNDLQLWAEDLIRQGLAGLPGKGYTPFEQQARRLIDAQAPGAARMVRSLGSVAASGGGWQEPFVEQLSMIHLLTTAASRMDALPEGLKADVRATLGIAVGQEELANRTGIRDTWQVIAQEVEVEDRLRAQRTWLVSGSEHRVAMILNFAHGTAQLDTSLVPGMEFEGEIVPLPGNGLRSAVRQKSASRAISKLFGFDSIEAALDRYSRLLAAQPWIGAIGFGFNKIIPANLNGKWFAIDSSGNALPLRCSDQIGWVCMATSGGEPIDLVAEFDGRDLRPLAVLCCGQFFAVSGG